MEELKPCPFCGELPEIRSDTISEGGEVIWYGWYAEHVCPSFKYGYNRLRAGYGCTRKEAVKAWNRRA